MIMRYLPRSHHNKMNLNKKHMRNYKITQTIFRKIKIFSNIMKFVIKNIKIEN
jgi:hypothetical protein